MNKRAQRLKPKFYEKVWGAKSLKPLFAGKGRKIGEAWLNGPRGESLPLLIKFLFTTDKLSVQVHPNDEYAAKHHGCLGKTEMWHVVAAAPGAKLAIGFREPISRERLLAAVSDPTSNEIETMLDWREARVGDTFFIPAGTVHAIGPGLVLCEVQQQSDITYRLYDYGRRREIHVEDGVAVSDCGKADAYIAEREGLLIDGKYFKVSLMKAREPKKARADYAMILRGRGTVNGKRTRAGEAWCSGSKKFVFDGVMDILLATIPATRSSALPNL
jgi:mannose-6-phosphate isomerase